MRRLFIAAAITACGLTLQGTIIDRIAIVAGDHIVKDSDIERDIRVVDFLNEENLDFSEQARRKAAQRLIDQAIIQRELEVGGYPAPPEADALKMFNQVQKDRFASAAVFQRALERYGLTPTQLKTYFTWQLTVLRFIDQRFRPGIQITDDEIEQYYRAHQAEFKTANGTAKTLEQAKEEIRQKLTDERIDKQFDSWLDARRRNLNIQYREESLK